MSHALIDISNVDFTWPSARAFRLEVAKLEVEVGSRVFLVGPSGSGKSTLLSLICGIVRPQAGKISILGTDIVQLSDVQRDRFRAEHIGVVFQQFNLLPYGSLVDNVLLPLSFAPERLTRVRANGHQASDDARRLLSALGLGDLPAGMPASDLSIGQQQRVAVARALIGSPELVIADEPTSALDRVAQDRFLDLIFEQLAATQATLLMVSHDERLAERFDRVIDLQDLITVRRVDETGEAGERTVAA
ncbi:MAG: ABC transporter ATP-binding protein [Pseudomonadota bacterium]